MLELSSFGMILAFKSYTPFSNVGRPVSTLMLLIGVRTKILQQMHNKFFVHAMPLCVLQVGQEISKYDKSSSSVYYAVSDKIDL